MSATIRWAASFFLFFGLITLGDHSPVVASRWEKISGPVQAVFLGDYPVQETVRVLATKPPAGDLFEYNLNTGTWTKIGGPGHMFTVDDVGRIYGLAADKKAVFLYDGQPMRWRRIGGPAETIVGARDGVAATDPKSGDIYFFTLGAGKWTRIGGPAKRLVADGRGRLYALSPDNVPANRAGVYLYTGTPLQWKKIGGPARELYPGQRTVYATNPQTNDVLRFDHAASRWVRVGGPGRMFAGGPDEILYGLASDGKAVFRGDLRTTQWQKIGGPATSIHAAGRELLAVDPESQSLYRYVSQDLPMAEFIVIAANSALAQAADDFMAWKAQNGHSIAVVTVDDICQSFSGVDTADRIRNYLIAVEKSRNLHYVLLLGDIDQLPTRVLYAGKVTIEKYRAYAADFYYANLSTKDWDPDRDGCWGEFEDDHFVSMAHHDAVVSRIPFNDAVTVKSVLANAVAFEKDGGAWKRKELLLCGFLDPNTDTAVMAEYIDKNILKPRGWTSRKLYFSKENTASQFLSQPNTTQLNESNYLTEVGPKRQGLILLTGHGAPSSIHSYYGRNDGSHATEAFHSTATISAAFCSGIVYVNGCSTAPPVGGSGPNPRIATEKSLWKATSADTRADHFGKAYLLGGAVAVIGASAGGDYESGWTGPQDGGVQTLAVYFHQFLVLNGDSVGDAFFRAMESFVESHGLKRGIRVFYLMGDPSITIP